MSRSSACSASSCARPSSTSPMITRMASAPCVRASITCHGSTKKSFASSGTSTARRTRLEVGQRAAEVALRRQHRDGRGARRLVRLGDGRPGSPRGAITPCDGDARFTSAMIDSPSPASAPAKWRVSRRFATSPAVQLADVLEITHQVSSPASSAAADDQAVQRRLGRAGIDGRGGLGHACRHVGGAAARHQAGGGVQHDGVALRALRAGVDGADGGGVVDGVAAAQLVGVGLREAQRRRRHRLLADALALDDRHQRHAGGRQLVDAAGAVHDDRALGAERRRHLRERVDQVGAGHADHLRRHRRRVGQRAEQVHDRADAELARGPGRRTASPGGGSART